MKKDIPFLPVENVMLAIVRTKKNDDGGEWYVVLMNKNDFSIKNVLVTSKGYGEKGGEKQETSVLRHFVEEVPAEQHATIEPIDPALFHLFNEFWVSYYINDQIFDKKFVFVPDSVSEDNIIKIKLLDLEGVLHS